MGKMDTIAPVPPAAISRVLATFDRDQLAGFIAVAIDLLDLADGDVEAEDATDAEDDFSLSQNAQEDGTDGPGCSIGDPGEYAGDERGDTSYLEWHTRGRYKADRYGAELLARDKHGNIQREDDEDGDPAEEDDPAGQCDEDGINTAQDTVRYTVGAFGPGCPISDPGGAGENEDYEPWQVEPEWSPPPANMN